MVAKVTRQQMAGLDPIALLWLQTCALGKDARREQTGEAFGNTRGTVRQFINVGDKPVRMITTLVVDKGKPRTMMQPDFK